MLAQQAMVVRTALAAALALALLVAGTAWLAPLVSCLHHDKAH